MPGTFRGIYVLGNDAAKMMAKSSSARNIEIKAAWTARAASPSASPLEAAREIARGVATERLSPQRQTDTYFQVVHGRLKLREIHTEEPQAFRSELIWYSRPDQSGPKASDYLLVPVANPELLKAALSGALGVRQVVVKRREIWLYHQVRIHLDAVENLGHFLEFEAVLGPEQDDILGAARVRDLLTAFGIRDQDLISGSYVDLLERSAGSGG